MKSLRQLAEISGSEVQGDEQLQISGVATLQNAREGQISFLSNPKYRKQLETTHAAAVILSPKLAADYSGNALINNDPYLAFAKIVNLFHAPEAPQANRHPSALVAADASIGENVAIGANVVIDSGVEIGANSKIGAGTVIGENTRIAAGALVHANVSIYPDIQIGKNVIIHSGAVIGSDGFGFALQADKSWYKIHQVGSVIIGDDVEIGANTSIDRGALEATLIGNGVKLDNQIQIAHNVHIDDHTIIAGAVGIAGSTTIGKRCQIGGAVGIAGHLAIADDVIITGKSMVISSIKEAGVYSSGIAAEENRKWRRNAARFRHLDEMAKQLKELQNIAKQNRNNQNLASD